MVSDMLDDCRLRRVPISVDDAIHDRLSKGSHGDGVHSAVSEAAGNVNEPIRCLASLLQAEYLLEQRTGTAVAPACVRPVLWPVGIRPRPACCGQSIGAIAAGDLAADVLHADLGSSYEEQRSSVVEPASAVDEVEPADQILGGGCGQGGVTLPATSPEVIPGDLDRDEADIIHSVLRWPGRPVKAAAMHPLLDPGRRIDIDAVPVHPPTDAPSDADRLDSLVGGQDQQPYGVKFCNTNADRQRSIGEFVDSVPQRIRTQMGADSGAVIGYAENDRSPSGRVGHASHLTGKVLSGPIVVGPSIDDFARRGSPPRLLFEFHMGGLDRTGGVTCIQKIQGVPDLTLEF